MSLRKVVYQDTTDRDLTHTLYNSSIKREHLQNDFRLPSTKILNYTLTNQSQSRDPNYSRDNTQHLFKRSFNVIANRNTVGNDFKFDVAELSADVMHRRSNKNKFDDAELIADVMSYRHRFDDVEYSI